MENISETGFEPAHPAIVAQDFGVHLRTIFRWVKRGWLTSSGGRITTDYKASILPEWKTSCSFGETQKRLVISEGTVRNWLKRGLLKRVMGSSQISLSSIENIISRQNNGTFTFYPDHNFPNVILQITGIGYEGLQACIDNQNVPSEVINGKRMIPVKEVAKIKRDWLSTCTSAEAERIIGKSHDTIRRWIKRGRLKIKVVVGKRRITIKSLGKNTENKQKLAEHIALHKQKCRRRLNNGKKKLCKRQQIEKQKTVSTKRPSQKFRAKRMDYSYKPKPIKLEIPDYKPKQVQVEGLGSKRLTNLEESAKATGGTKEEIRKYFMNGRLRGENVDDNIFIYIASLEAFISKLKQGSITG